MSIKGKIIQIDLLVDILPPFAKCRLPKHLKKDQRYYNNFGNIWNNKARTCKKIKSFYHTVNSGIKKKIKEKRRKLKKKEKKMKNELRKTLEKRVYMSRNRIRTR